MKRKTLRQSISVQGVGLHTGTKTTVVLHPAHSGTGIVFRVRVRDRSVDIPALTPFVRDTQRRVVLGKEGVTVQTVEHLLAAFFGMGITDVIVEVEGEELPIGDGSALLWLDAVQQAGITPTDGPVPMLTVTEPITLAVGGARLRVLPCDRFVARYTFVTKHPLVGVQEATFDEATDDFAVQVAPARTFGFWEEVQTLWWQGLAKGGSLDNAVVIFRDRYSTPLRFENELARHKLLDLMGDLALLGARVRAVIDAQASGHTLHHRLCQNLWQLVVQEANG